MNTENTQEQKELINAIVDHLVEDFFKEHLKKITTKHSKLKSYKRNPFTDKFSAKFFGAYTPENLAKGLLYPKVNGTSLATSFGTILQQILVTVKIVDGATNPGIDIEFIDKTSRKKKYCQLKAGPNTINSGDIKKIKENFEKIIKLARTNDKSSELSNNDFIVGLLYGSKKELSSHYKKINESYPVLPAEEFWYKITGYQDFYQELIKAVNEAVEQFSPSVVLDEALNLLTEEIKKSDKFNFT